MSCECEKLRQLYERFNSEHLEVITQAQNHVYSSAVGNGQDICESQLIKPTYENSTMEAVTPYETTQNTASYGLFNVISYDSPGFMADSVQDYTPLPKNVERNIDPNIERLEEMITKAKEDPKWMSTMQ